MKHFYIETYGCQMNKADSTGIAHNLIDNGFVEVKDKYEADVIIINTCSVRKTAETRIWGELGHYKSMKEKKHFILAVVGCMAQRLGENFFEYSNTPDLVIGTYFKNNISGILKNYRAGEKKVFTKITDLEFSGSFPDPEYPKKAYVTISHGCNNFCSYCIVPYLRGEETSRPSKEIIDDINKLTDQGVIQVTLLGQNVNSYGRDKNDVSFPGLLRMISSETDIKWIKYLSSHPKDFTDELIDTIVSEDKVSKWLHLAVQSGSNRILDLMNRNYKIEDYAAKVEKLKSRLPSLNLTTDIIVGFPDETEEDYNDTLKLIKHIEFDDAYMYKYNSRESTLAQNKFADNIPDEVKINRLTNLISIQKKIGRKRKISRTGKLFEVIAEKWSKKGDNEILGLTKEDFMIIFKGDINDFDGTLKVRATELEGNTLHGEKIDDID